MARRWGMSQGAASEADLRAKLFHPEATACGSAISTCACCEGEKGLTASRQWAGQGRASSAMMLMGAVVSTCPRDTIPSPHHQEGAVEVREQGHWRSAPGAWRGKLDVQGWRRWGAPRSKPVKRVKGKEGFERSWTISFRPASYWLLPPGFCDQAEKGCLLSHWKKSLLNNYSLIDTDLSTEDIKIKRQT